MKKNWFYQPDSKNKLIIIGVIILLLVVMIELAVSLHPYFKIEQVFGFHAWYGFLACVALVIIAKLLGLLLKRKEDYYEDRSRTGDKR